MKLKLPVWECYVQKWIVLCVLTTIVLLQSSFQVQAQNVASTITFKGSNIKAAGLFREIEKQTATTLTYNEEEINAIVIRSVNWNKITLENALKELQSEYGIQYAISGNNIALKAGPKPAVKKFGKMGVVSGKIIDQENADPVQGSTIQIGSKTVTSGIDGMYHVSLPEGKYTAEISSVGFAGKKITDIIVKVGEAVEVNMALKRSKDQLANVTVTASARKESVNALYARQKNAASVTDGISAEQIARTPDINLGQVLKRVSGVTTVDNKYVVIRGLGDRYNQPMIDGTVLPSTNMNKRNFSFDVIPQELVSSVVVNKTATPDVSSEFSGGQVLVNTMDIPTQNFTSINVGTGYNDQSTGKDFLTMGERGKHDYWGYDDGRRKEPAGIQSWIFPSGIDAPPPGPAGNKEVLIPGTTTPYSSLDAIAQSKKLSGAGYKINRYNTPPDQQYRLALGRTYTLPHDMKFGFAAAATYRNQQRIVPYNNVRGAVTSANYMDSTENGAGTSYRFNTTLGAGLNLGLQGKRFKISLKNLFSRIFDDNFNEAYRLDYHENPDTKFREMFQDPQATEVWQNRLEGDCQLTRKGLKLEYTGAVTNIHQQVTDQRRAKYLRMASVAGKDYFQMPNVYSPNRNGDNYDYRLWTNVKETDYNWGLSLSQPFTFLKDKSTVKIGYAGWQKHRTLSITLMVPYANNTSANGFQQPYWEVLDTANMGYGAGQAYYWAQGLNGPTFDGTMKTHAVYAMLDQRLLKKLRLIYGLRAEHYNLGNRQDEFIKRQYGSIPDAFKLFTTTGEKNWRLLPSANLIYSLTPAMNIRLAYSKTAIRPDFRETSYFGFYDYEMDANISGRQVVSTIVDNFDLRYEWYPSPGEIISVSGFYKHMNNPIELVETDATAGYFRYQNQYAAKNYGVEMEFRKNLGFIADKEWLNNIVIFGNGTLIKSKVQLQTQPLPNENVAAKRLPNQDRPLYGQAPWIMNAGIAWQSELVGFTASYNRSGHRSYSINANPGLLEYERGRNLLDMQLSARFFKKKAEVKLNFGNLLNEYILFYQNINAYENKLGDNGEVIGYKLVNGTTAYEKDKGDRVTYRVKTGRTYSVSFTYRF